MLKKKTYTLSSPFTKSVFITKMDTDSGEDRLQPNTNGYCFNASMYIPKFMQVYASRTLDYTNYFSFSFLSRTSLDSKLNLNMYTTKR